MGDPMMPSFSHTYLGLAILLGSTLSFNPDPHNPGLEALIDLYTGACPAMDICSYKALPMNLSETYEYDELAYCCMPPCSCNFSCFLEDNCCPDLHKKLLNEAVFHDKHLPNYDTLQSWIKYERGYVMYLTYEESLLQIDPNGTDMPNGANDLESTECIDMTFPTNKHFLPTESTYYVFNNCSVENDTETINMCRQVNISSDAYTLADITPVVSSYSHLSYRNKYCMACNEPFSQWEPWEAQLVCLRDKPTRIPAAEELDDVVKFVTKENHCSLTFKLPHTSLGNMFSFKCQNVQIKSCNVTGFWQNYDQNIDEACKRYRGPVTALIKSYSDQSITFNNMACLKCNSPVWGINDTCFSQQPNSSDVHVSVYLNTGDTGFGYQPSQDFPREYYADPERRNCENGQLYDSITGQCRDTYCPRYHAIKDEMCSPIFDSMDGVGLSLQLKLKLDAARTGTFSHDVDHALQDRSLKFFSSLGLRVCSTSIWRKYEAKVGKNIDYLFMPLTLNTDSHRYNTLMYYVQNLINTAIPFGDILDSDNRKINYTITFADEIVMRTVYDETVAIDLTDGKKLQESGLILKDVHECKVSMTMTVNSFCERVALNVDEYEIRGESLFFKLKDNLIHGTNYDLLKDRRALICIEKYKKMLESQTVDQEVEIANVENDYQETFDTDPEGLSINTSFFLGIIVSTIFLGGLFVTLGLIRKQYCSAQPQQQHITMRTSPIEETLEIA